VIYSIVRNNEYTNAWLGMNARCGWSFPGSNVTQGTIQLIRHFVLPTQIAFAKELPLKHCYWDTVTKIILFISLFSPLSL